MELVARDISKSFGPIKAVDRVSITFKSGEVKAVVGENGAGKSTLVKTLAGLCEPDSGSVTLGGAPFSPANLSDGVAKGVSIVFQETTINPYLTVAENIFIDRLRSFTKWSGVIDWKRLMSCAEKVLESVESDIDVNASVGSLDLGQWKIIELARALSYEPKVLFLDEVTAFLNAQEVKRLLQVVESLRNKGMAIGFISHHLSQVFEIADTVTVMKDGKWVADHHISDVTRREVEAMMVGRDVGESIYPVRRQQTLGDVVLSVDGLNVVRGAKNVSFQLRKGEILGIGGLKGAGGEGILRAIYGDMPFEGTMLMNGIPFSPRNPHQAVAAGVALVPGERTLEGLITILSVLYNLSLMRIPKKGFIIDKRAELSLAEKYVNNLMIKTPSLTASCSNLSGGNAQKVVLGKCLASHPQVLLLNNPTRGIDVGARYEIYHVIQELISQGLSIILLSEDLPELLAMSDRLLIMRRGQVSKTFIRDDKPSEEEVISYML